MHSFRRNGRFLVALLSLTIAFVLSVQFSDRGVQFDLRHSQVAAAEGADEAYDLSSLKVLNRVLLQLKDNYVEPERIQPAKMLVASLEAIQNNIAEVVIAYDQKGDATPAFIDVSVGDKTKRFDVRNIESLWEMSFRLKEIFLFMEQHLEKDADRKVQEVEYAAINGLLSTLDPHSNLLPPAQYEEMQTQTGGKFGGLGIVISIRDGALTVISPIDGTPASQKGIKAQDMIVRIGEESTVNMNLNEAVNMLRGDPGTDIDLWVLRKGWTDARQFTLTRAIIKIDSVDSQALANKVGYIRIKNFQANTTTDLVAHLKKLKERMGGLQGVVLDMRDNPGGLLDQSIRVSDLFLNEGTIVSTVGVGNKLRETKTASKAGSEPDYPIIVLLNGGSASASEIVAGALQNNNRAIVLGDTSFGKGTVQILYEFPDSSALKLTVAQYLTPGGVSIQSRGIIPDLHTVPVNILKNNVQMFLSQNNLREQDLSSHLVNRTERAGEGQISYIRYLNPDAQKELAEGEEEEFVDPNVFKEDFEIRLAQQLVVASGKEWRRSAQLNNLQGELKKIYDRELATITAELKKLGVDWSDGTSAQKPNVDLKVSTSRDNDTVAAGEKFTINAELTNRGSEPLYRVKGSTRSDNPMLRDREFLFGKLMPGQTKKWAVEVSTPKDSASRHDHIDIVLSDANREFEGQYGLDLKTNGQPRPHFGFSYEVIDANGDGLLQKGEDVTFRIFVENMGGAQSEDTTVFLKNLSGGSVYLHRGREKLGKIKVDERKSVDFSFTVKTPPKASEIELQVDIYDMTYREFVQKKFTIPFVSTSKKVNAANGTATVSSGPAKIFGGASAQTDTIAMAQAGATMPVVGRLDGWLKLDLGHRKAWIEQERVDFKDGQKAELKGVDQMIVFQKPRVELKPEVMMTSAKSVGIKGAITDSSAIKDYYVIVHQQEDLAKFNTLKLNYLRVGGQQADITANVPLFKGMNRISVVTRNDVGMSTTESVFVFRKQ
ncbi:MAG: PDZ domain-containing protein [Bradymonadaceae bacterium]|nr:PDZ domain-containing protein [Lujinxingiaceae bacterium]